MDAFRTACLDPPWLERGAGKIKRGADRHYPLVATRDMPLVIAKSGLWRPAEHAHCYLWVTNNFLRDGLWLMEQLGFDYKTNIAWAKSQMGLGQYFRGQHELLLFGARGRGKDESVYQGRRDLSSLAAVDHVRVNGKRLHSGKPEAFYELIEARSKGPYLEMFARSGRSGWVSWGNEVEES